MGEMGEGARSMGGMGMGDVGEGCVGVRVVLVVT